MIASMMSGLPRPCGHYSLTLCGAALSKKDKLLCPDWRLETIKATSNDAVVLLAAAVWNCGRCRVSFRILCSFLSHTGFAGRQARDETRPERPPKSRQFSKSPPECESRGAYMWDCRILSGHRLVATSEQVEPKPKLSSPVGHPINRSPKAASLPRHESHSTCRLLSTAHTSRNNAIGYFLRPHRPDGGSGSILRANI